MCTRRHRIAGLTVIALMLVTSCVIAYAVSASAAQISVVPSSLTVFGGENFTVDIYIDPEGNKTAGAAYLLYFNNTLLNATSLTSGSFFNGYDTLSVGEGINNTRGWIDYGEYITGGGWVTDSGTFTTITFQAIGEQGISELRFDEMWTQLSDPDGYSIPINICNGNVKIVEGDLVISNIWAHWHNNSICYQVTNIANGTVPSGHNTTLYIDGEEKVHDAVPVALALNESYVGCFNYSWAFVPPEDNITVCADNNENVMESNESNNCFTITVSGHCGDVNNDGSVTTMDGMIVFKHYFHPDQYPLSSEWAADVNCDGSITTMDGMIIFKHYFHPEEYPLNCC